MSPASPARPAGPASPAGEGRAGMARPASVERASWVIWALVVVATAVTVLAVVRDDDLVAAWAGGQGRSVDDTRVPPSFTPVVVVLYVVISILLLVLLAFLRGGHNWARHCIAGCGPIHRWSSSSPRSGSSSSPPSCWCCSTSRPRTPTWARSPGRRAPPEPASGSVQQPGPDDRRGLALDALSALRCSVRVVRTRVRSTGGVDLDPRPRRSSSCPRDASWRPCGGTVCSEQEAGREAI